MRKPYKYQQQIIEQIKPMYKIALFVEMRLGKTLMTIHWILSKKVKRILIFCPKSVVPVWLKELKKEGIQETNVTLVIGSTKEKIEKVNKKYSQQHFFITNYESIVYSPEILELNWDLIVADESTKIRNPQAKTTKYLISRTKNVTYKAILSGLPNPESEADYFEQMKFLHGTFMGCENFWQWRKVHCFQIGYDWQLKKWAREELLKQISRNAIVLTRKDAGIGESKIYEERYTFMTPEQKKKYNEMLKDFETKINDELITTKYIAPKLEYLSQIANGITPQGQIFSEEKFWVLIDLLKTELKNESVVVWCKHTAEIMRLSALLTEEKIKHAIFYSETKQGETDFKSGKVKIIIAQPKGSQYGLDWSIADTMIFFSNWWDGEVRAQCEDRIVHPDKKKPLLYIDLMCKGTIEEDIVELLRKKQTGSQLFIRQLTEKIKQRTERWRNR